ncbi:MULTISPECIES: nuclear transport factor 2 family protein [unclassified Roseovarius]|uniref:nuclear transport factor 2 family protein n=1 Tax=unclassified Roseovarius TaxID=2614913 RepID=UPI00274016D0|nr:MULTISPECIES: nuclear transport factor 2 family protein [unclassified Roseovarius]
MTETNGNADGLLAELTACECAVWDALLRGDAKADAAALDESFLGVYPDGFSGKAAHIGQLEDGPTIKAYTLSDLRARALGPDHAILSYRADFERPSGPRAEVMYVSSIWQRRGASWINIFSQDTPAAP